MADVYPAAYVVYGGEEYICGVRGFTRAGSGDELEVSLRIPDTAHLSVPVSECPDHIVAMAGEVDDSS